MYLKNLLCILHHHHQFFALRLTNNILFFYNILLDFQDYHTPIQETGEIARDSNVKHLLIYHSIPTPQNSIMENVFLRPLEGIFEDYTLSDDGTRVIMPVGNSEIIIDKIQ